MKKFCECKESDVFLTFDLALFVKSLNEHNFKIDSLELYIEYDIFIELVKTSTPLVVQKYFESSSCTTSAFKADNACNRLAKSMFMNADIQMSQYFVSVLCTETNSKCNFWREQILTNAVAYGSDDKFIDTVVTVFASYTGSRFISYNDEPSFIDDTNYYDDNQNDDCDITCDLPSIFISNCIKMNNPKSLSVFICQIKERFINFMKEFESVLSSMFVVSLRSNNLSFCDIIMSKQQPIELTNFHITLPRLDDGRGRQNLTDSDVEMNLDSLIYLHDLYSKDLVIIRENEKFVPDMLKYCIEEKHNDMFVYLLTMFPLVVSQFTLPYLTEDTLFHHKVCSDVIVQNIGLFEELASNPK